MDHRLTLAQIQAIQADGNEIGGHTVNHLHLPVLDQAEQARQICDDRVALAQNGLTVTSFAYPFASLDSRTEEIVKKLRLQQRAVGGSSVRQWRVCYVRVRGIDASC